MITESIYKRYEPSITTPATKKQDSLWFIFNGNKLLVKTATDKVALPVWREMEALAGNLASPLYLGELEGCQCFCCEYSEGLHIPEGFEFRDLRPLFGAMEDDLFLLAGKAFQVMNWNRNTQYCGKCGTPTEHRSQERAKICPKCGLLSYPNVVPAIIVAVRKENSLLLAHAKHFTSNMYSVIAGFVEAGETFEECVKREVMEEVGIRVKNIRYFGSQPWPFPNSIMVAFTADYESGEIQVDGVEIGDAGWYTVDNLPMLPMGYSIAKALIDWFIDSTRKQRE